MNTGSWNSITRLFASAAVMKSCQMSAGIVPPNTGENPSTLYIGICPSACPTHTHAASCGVKPQNHASRYSWFVPVLPAAGLPMFASVPVPLVITVWSA